MAIAKRTPVICTPEAQRELTEKLKAEGKLELNLLQIALLEVDANAAQAEKHNGNR
jgi:hypothetical protein